MRRTESPPIDRLLVSVSEQELWREVLGGPTERCNTSVSGKGGKEGGGDVLLVVSFAIMLSFASPKSQSTILPT